MELSDDEMTRFDSGFDAGIDFMVLSFSVSMIDQMIAQNTERINYLLENIAYLKFNEKHYYDAAHPNDRIGEYNFWMLNQCRDSQRRYKAQLAKCVELQKRLKQLSRQRMEIDRELERNRFNG